MVGLHPLGIVLPLGFAILCALLLPALAVPWKGFCIYAALAIATALALWYASDIPSTTILVGSVTGGLALAIGLIVQVLRKPTNSFLIPRPWLVAATFVATPIVALLGIEIGKFAWYRHDLPAAFADSKAIYLPRVLGARCEIAVWLLPEGGSAGLKLEEVTHEWQKSPYRVNNLQPDPKGRWLNGIGCSAASAAIKESIIDAMNLPGSMYLVEANNGFILLPSKNILVQSYVR